MRLTISKHAHALVDLAIQASQTHVPGIVDHQDEAIAGVQFEALSDWRRQYNTAALAEWERVGFSPGEPSCFVGHNWIVPRKLVRPTCHGPRNCRNVSAFVTLMATLSVV